jgi:hypothetical protein
MTTYVSQFVEAALLAWGTIRMLIEVYRWLKTPEAQHLLDLLAPTG